MSYGLWDQNSLPLFCFFLFLVVFFLFATSQAKTIFFFFAGVLSPAKIWDPQNQWSWGLGGREGGRADLGFIPPSLPSQHKVGIPFSVLVEPTQKRFPPPPQIPRLW